ncbi:MAG: ribonuclease H-like domain-containing protein [Gudongella sp.]|nr:ribonuclease H-like domain-containing protein [Gudongella sp.]
MRIIKSIIDIPLEFKPMIEIENLCFFDIETTGLSREYNQIYLIGTFFYNKESSDWTLIQFFAEDLSEEEELLLRFVAMAKDFEILATYNGDSFDLPFVRKRLEKYGHFWDVDNSLDIYRYVKDNRSILDMPDLKLKTLEKQLGIYRDDLISGKDCIELYKSYKVTKSEEKLHPILQHNYDDLQYMPHLLQVYNMVERHKTIEISSVDTSVHFYLDTMNFAEEKLMVNGSYNPKFSIPWNYYRPFYTFILDSDSLFQFTIETKKARLSEDILADIVDARLIEELNVEMDLSPHESPKGILILKANKNIYIDNIKRIIESLFLFHFEK